MVEPSLPSNCRESLMKHILLQAEILRKSNDPKEQKTTYDEILKSTKKLTEFIKGAESDAIKQQLTSFISSRIKEMEEFKKNLKKNDSQEQAPTDEYLALEKAIKEEKALSTEKIEQKFEYGSSSYGLQHQHREATLVNFMKENVILPFKFPKLFEGLKHFNSTLLLFGPAGSGKTHLVKATVGEAAVKYFIIQCWDLRNILCSMEFSDYVIGLVNLAKARAPCILLFEDIDVLFKDYQALYGTVPGRNRTEFLIQMEIISKDSQIKLIATSQNPWEIDISVRRRLCRRIYIPLLTTNERKLILTESLKDLNSETIDFMVDSTEGCSAADLSCLVRDLLLEPIRNIHKSKKVKRILKLQGPKLIPCAEDDPEGVSLNWDSLNPEEVDLSISLEDVKKVLSNFKPSIDEKLLESHLKFQEEFC